MTAGAEGFGVGVGRQAQNFVFGLRAFLRFCFPEGLIGTDLSETALPVTGRRRLAPPRGIADADVQAILASCDRRTALGRRDYAIVILLVRLGASPREVAALSLDDIDWQAGELVVRGKGGRADRLPLPDDVGRAIAGWLRSGRPASSHREVFLRDHAPVAPIAAGPSPPRSAVRAGGPASPRWILTGCVIPQPARWCPPVGCAEDCSAGRLYRQAFLTTGDAEMAEQVVSDVIVEECVRPAAAVRGQDAGRRLAVSAYRRCMELAGGPAPESGISARRTGGCAGRAGPGGLSGLSTGERGVLGLVACGALGYRQAGVELGLSASEVSALLRAALVKAAACVPGSLPRVNQERVWP